MRKAFFKKYQLHFRNPIRTSRGEMHVKNGYYLSITEDGKTGTGECSFIEGLSIDDLAYYETTLQNLCNYIETGAIEIKPDLTLFPSIRFGWECALLELSNGGNNIFYKSDFTKGIKQIPVNGLVWMGNKDFMLQQIEEKLNVGFKCIKIKVGAIDFEEEVMMLDFIRHQFHPDIVEIRLDANGAFSPEDVFQKLETLSKFHIHSIEQPIIAGKFDLMKEVCSRSPIPVALDEELIGLPESQREILLKDINPRYLILKPSLLGGFETCNQWIELSESKGIGWWATSALESNIGLNAIAQWMATKNNPMVQGLGTGDLYTSNVPSPLYMSNGYLGYNPDAKPAD